MEIKPRLLGLVISGVLMVVIVELVRRRKLREEYSILWLSLSAAMFVLALLPDLLNTVTGLIGAVIPTSTLFFFGLIFLIFINIQFSVQISSLSSRVKDLTQHVALLQCMLEDIETQRPLQPEKELEAGRQLRTEQLESLLVRMRALEQDRTEVGQRQGTPR